MKYLYLQIRKDLETRAEEFAEFVRFSGLPAESFTVINVFETPVFDKQILDDHKALFIGGSSDDPEDKVEMPIDEYPYIISSEELIQYAYDTKTPTFASCMGFHIATWTLGGEIILDKEHKEIGTYDITLTDAALTDPLFSNIPQTFTAVSGHKKRATKLPPNAIHLASSELCPIHIYTFPDRPFYAFQFHPELDKPDLSARLVRYMDRGYFKNIDDCRTLIDSLEETPYANQLVKNFAQYVL